MAACSLEIHHHIPRYLLVSYERYVKGGLDSEGLQAWFDWEEDAYRHGVDPDISRSELADLIEASAIPVPMADHRRYHSEAGDFSRWRRRGGLDTLAIYGRPGFRSWGAGGGGGLAPRTSDATAQNSSSRRRG